MKATGLPLQMNLEQVINLTYKVSIEVSHISRKNSNYRSSRPEVFCKKGALRNFAKFTGKYLCQNLFFNKVASLFFSTP